MCTGNGAGVKVTDSIPYTTGRTFSAFVDAYRWFEHEILFQRERFMKNHLRGTNFSVSLIQDKRVTIRWFLQAGGRGLLLHT